MKIKTSELTGAALDWAVAKCEGVALLDPHNNEWELCWTLLGDNSGDYYQPSCDWAQGGPIIEREGIAIRRYGDFPETRWQSDTWQFRFVDPQTYGHTPLVAAMRCRVASKLGDEVEIPEELT
jgi:hypothetical protein